MSQSLTGRILGQYKLIEMVGTSGLSTVYKAYQPNLERWVAVKVLHATDKVLLARFKREAKAVAKLRHRNILIVHEYNEEDDIPYIAMEYVEEGTLADTLHGEPVAWQDILGIIIPVGEALHFAHQRGLIHRDVKPSNILMAEKDWPLLADFGLAKMQGAGEPITNSGEIVGTPGYIPPEQATGNEATPRSDLYSLGVILFEMITGRLPFQHRSPHQVLLSHISDEVPLPSQFNPNCPAKLEEIILKALQKSPQDRYADVQAMVDALTNFAENSDIHFMGSTPGTQRLPPLAELSRPSTPNTRAAPPADQETTKPRLWFDQQNVTVILPDPHLTAGDLIIGRAHSGNRVEVDLTPFDAMDAGVSRRHARLIKRANDWLIEDLGSMNGTFVNEARLIPGQPVLLHHNSVIRCSLLSFVFLNAPG